MVVGGSDGHHLADTQLVKHFLRHGLVLGWIVNGTGCNDGPLVLHQAGNRRNRTDGAGIGQCNSGILEIRNFKVSGPGFLNKIGVGVQELFEVHLVNTLDIGHQKVSGPVFVLHIHGNTKVYLVGYNLVGLLIFIDERVVHIGKLFQAFDDRPGNEMGEGGFGVTPLQQMPVDDGAVFN